MAVPQRGSILSHPEICNRTPDIASPTVCYRGFAIPLTNEEIADYIDKLYPGLNDLLVEEKMLGFKKEYRKAVPEGIEPRVARLLVPILGQGMWPCLGVVIATNISEEDRNRAKEVDPPLIKQLQANLATTNAPGWFRIVSNFDLF